MKVVYVTLPIILVAGLGTLFVNIGMEWFNSLLKPTQWIPNFVIPIVWTIIYLAFAIILLVWLFRGRIPLPTIILLALNGIFNILWCLIFFTLKQTFLGNITIILNLILGVLLVVNIYRQKRVYGFILSIYPIWLSIATTLNLAMWILN